MTDLTPYARLDPDAVLDAVESVGFVTDARILALNSYENRVYQVGIEGGAPVVVKFYRPERWSDAAILEEHAYTRELEDLDIPVVAPLPGPDGTTLHSREGLRFALYPRLAGRAPDVEDFDELLIMGRFVGRIHAVGRLEPFRHRPALSSVEFGHAAREFLLASDFVPDEMRPAWESVTEDLLRRIEKDFPALDAFGTLRLHGDCHMGNVLWRDDVPHFVDFDDARNGPAIQDLWMMLSGDRAERTGQIAEIVEGYDEFHDFDPRQLVLIEPLRTLRIMHHAAWIGRRWQDPAFPRAFPFFTDLRFWGDQVLALREQQAALMEPPLRLN